MINFNKEELLELAEMSSLKLYNHEIDDLTKQIKKLLEYTEELNKVTLSHESAPTYNVNIFRDDVVQYYDSTSILKQAPQENNHYFIVPKILEKK